MTVFWTIQRNLSFSASPGAHLFHLHTPGGDTTPQPPYGIIVDIHQFARDIMLFLDSLAEYDLEAESNPPEEDFVEYFLFQSHRGYCVHFARSRCCLPPAPGMAPGHSVPPRTETCQARESPPPVCDGIYAFALGF